MRADKDELELPSSSGINSRDCRSNESRPVIEAQAMGDMSRAVAGFLCDFSIEILQSEADETRLVEILAPRTSVYLPHTRKSSAEQTIAAARRLRSAGFDPVPHIAARRVASRQALERLLSQLREEAGVETVLLIGGDIDSAAGAFSEAMDVLRTGFLERSGLVRLGLAGHPEGIRGIDGETLIAKLREKCACARQAGLRPYIVTQFCFDPTAIIAWDKRARDAGVDSPVHVGLPGATTLRKLLLYATKCGVGDSIRFLSGNISRAAGLAAHAIPERLVNALAAYRASDPESLIAKAHFFPFGALEDTARWIELTRQGCQP